MGQSVVFHDPYLKQSLEEILNAYFDNCDLPLQKEIFILRFVEGQEYADIATILGMSMSTIKTRVHRMRLALRDSLSSLN
ncbi:hypothetical protein KW791_01920 [Candidatus Parcubacteria bacterium]|nr:hypothetical protein [Candidatus Parcubacteria bacterium]